jgi:diguanylate cyclase (GGDEF)-like protein
MDEIQRKMDTEAFKITMARQALEKTLTGKNYLALLDQLFAIATRNQVNQDLVYDIMLQDKPAVAREFLMNVIIPVQDNALAKLKTFQEKLHLKATQNQQRMHYYLKQNKILWTTISIIFAFSLLIISVFTLKRLRQQDQIQVKFQQQLEDKVEHRSMELHLDSSVLHNIHEAVAVANCAGEFIKTNPQFDKFLIEANIQADNAWAILNEIIPHLSIDETQCILLDQGFSRYEAEINIQNRQHHYFVDVFCVDDEHLNQRYISLLLTDVTELKNTQQHLQKMANFDTVTQLPNRHFFQTHLQQAIDNQAVRKFTLFYIDLDNFKWINDTLGHASGDNFLREIAKLLEQTFINDDQILVSRLGGDEFAILVENGSDDSLGHIADQILKSCKEINDINHYSKTVGCSIGVASYPKDGKSQEDLMRHADFAMYKAKEQGKNQYCFFSDEMDQRIHYLYDMEQNLLNCD